MRPDATRCLLLIDDEPAQRRLVSAIGARAGWWVMGAPDVETAQKLLAGEDLLSGFDIGRAHHPPAGTGADRAYQAALGWLVVNQQQATGCVRAHGSPSSSTKRPL